MSGQLSRINDFASLFRQWLHTFGLALPLAVVGNCLQPTAAIAQIMPDNTLGTEQSILNPDGTWNGSPASLIEGGVVRGENLFHSFTEFNVGTLDWVYFVQPDTVNRILTRVTGDNASFIDGTLGVTGNADLFVLNPNGVLFGPNARLDIQGSFLASTADGLDWGNGLEFSASDPQAPPLLTVDLPFSLNYFPGNSGVLSNQGQLTAGNNLTLAGQQVELQGTLEADGDINLLGNQAVQIRDTAEQPFRTTAQGNLLIQGNDTVDIFALNHLDSWLASGQNITLRSDGDIVGDALFWGSGHFSTETLSGQSADLLSPNDPIILAVGDVTIADYVPTNPGETTASLHILAGGSVTVGDVVINARGNDTNTINPAHAIEFIQRLSNVPLSDGTAVTIDGSNGPDGALTLDIRAGIDWSQVPGFPGDSIFGVVDPLPVFSPATSADIRVGNIQTAVPTQDPRRGGTVLLTNQYFASGIPGNISTGEIRSISGAAGGGSVVIDSRGDINIGDNGGNFSIAARPLDPGLRTFNGGDVRLLASGEITATDQIDVSGALGGTVTINTGTNLDLTTNIVSFNYAETLDNAQGGSINLASAGTITIRDGAEVITASREATTASAGDINVSANRLELINPANIQEDSALNAQTRGQGNGGTITVNVGEVLLDQGYIFANALGAGDAGNVVINGDRLTLQANPERDNAAPFISVASQGAGDGGKITVNTPTGITELVGTDRTGLPSAFVFAGFDTGGPGSLEINTRELFVREGALISGSAYDGVIGNVNDSGSIVINSSELIEVSGSGSILPSSLVLETASDSVDGGIFNLSTRQLRVLNGGNISAQSIGAANAGTLRVDADVIRVSGTSADNTNNSPSRLFFDSQNSGQAGGIDLRANQVFVEDGGLISVSGRGTGNSGNLSIASDTVTLRNGGTIRATTQAATGGNLNFNGQSQILMECCNNEISAEAFGSADGGNIRFNFRPIGGRIDSPSPLSDNNDVIANAESGNGGIISLINFLDLFDQGPQNFVLSEAGRTPNSDFTARSISGEDGDVEINVRDNVESEQLPEDFSTEPISNACTVGGTTSVEALSDRPTFTIPGKGGIPGSFAGPLSRDRPHVSLTEWPGISYPAQSDAESTFPKPDLPLALRPTCFSE